MNKKLFPSTNTLILTLGELLVSLLVIGGYLIVDLIFETDYFSYRVITGAVLGSAVIVLNHLFLTVFLNRAVNRFMEKRGTAAMDDEEAARFAAENMASIKSTITVSFIARTVSMLAALVVAFILDWFAPVATVIPIVAFRPILTVSSIIRSRRTASLIPGGLETSFTELSEDGEAAVTEDTAETDDGVLEPLEDGKDS